MSDIFREVDEEVRKDRFQTLWKQYGIYLYIIIGGLILGTGFNSWWRYYQDNQRLEESTAFQASVALLDKQQSTEAINGFARLADNAGTGYATLARLREAAARAEQGDLDGAVRAYDRLSEDDGVDDIYRDLSRLLAVQQLADTASSDEILRRTAPLAVDGGAWRFSAREVNAVVALRDGRRGEARNMLQALVDEAETPPGVRGRARELLAALASEE